jgi:hypothetical protein
MQDLLVLRDDEGILVLDDPKAEDESRGDSRTLELEAFEACRFQNGFASEGLLCNEPPIPLRDTRHPQVVTCLQEQTSSGTPAIQEGGVSLARHYLNLSNRRCGPGEELSESIQQGGVGLARNYLIY